METEIKFCPRCGAEITTLTSGYICPKCGLEEGSSDDIIEIPFGAHDSELKGWEYTIPKGMEAKIENGRIIVREKESEDDRIRSAMISGFNSMMTNQCVVTFAGEPIKNILAYLEKQKKQKPDEGDFTVYHPLKNGKGEYECIPYSFYGSLKSFSEDKDLIDFLRICFYTKEECNEWIERQKGQKMVNLEIPAGDVAPAEENGPFDEDEFLEGELSAFLQSYDKEYDDDAAVSDVAKHFYELGKEVKQKSTAEEVLVRAGLKPFKDGNQWSILVGDNIQEGVCGFGDTIEDALCEFLKDVCKQIKRL